MKVIFILLLSLSFVIAAPQYCNPNLPGGLACGQQTQQTTINNINNTNISQITQIINSTYWNLSGTNLFPQSNGYRVGIGTATPIAALDVRGQVNVSGNVTATYFIGSGQFLTGISGSTYNSTYAQYAYNQSDGSYNATYAQFAYNQSTSPAGTTGSIQFNQNNNFAGDENNFYYQFSKPKNFTDSNNLVRKANFIFNTEINETSSQTFGFGSITNFSGTKDNNGLGGGGFMEVYVSNQSNTNFSQLRGLSVFTRFKGSGFVNSVAGINGQVEYRANSTLPILQALGFSTLNFGTGTVTDLKGVVSQFGNQLSGNITNAKAYDATFSNAGRVNNTYGYYAGDLTAGTQINTPYSFYASDSGTYNYFAGSVGIGTTIPAYKLDVNGNASFAGNTRITNTNYLEFGDGTVGLRSNKATSGDLEIYTGNTLRMTVNSSNGNVGIGTASPTSPLTVQSASSADKVAIKSSPSANNEFRIYMDDSATNGVQLYTVGSSPLGFATNSTGNKLTITSSGVVGVNIGSTNPGVPSAVGYFHVAGVNGITQTYAGTLETGTSSVYNRFSKAGLDVYYGTDSSSGGGLASGSLGNSSGWTNYQATPIHLSTNNLVRFTVAGSGDVGIGTTTPTQKLDVRGNVNVSGNITIKEKITTYNNNPTYGNGVASIVNRSTIINQTIFADATLEKVLWTAPVAGEYRVSGYVLTTFEGNFDDSTYDIDLIWEDETQVQTIADGWISPISLTTFGDKQYNSAIIHVKQGGQINITETSSGIVSETSRYSQFITVERLN